MTKTHILVINAGSSNYKLALYSITKASLEHPQKPVWSCVADVSKVKPKDAIKKQLDQMVASGSIDNFSSIDVVGHRIVHGGSHFTTPTRITAKVKTTIKSLFTLAPLHNPAGLAGIEVIESLMPKTPQIAVFDTAFHSTLPEAASTYPGPYKWKEMGIKRYGFHGISHHYCAIRCAELLKRDVKNLRIVTAHLGNGCSLAAINKGKSIDTTMGFTPMDGLMMGTRPGALDPGIEIYLEEQKHKSAESLFHVLNHESGLKGISGSTSDMRDILKQRKEGNKRAALAYDMFVHSLRRNIGAMAGVLDGVDALVFAGGIGENSSDVRSEGTKALVDAIIDKEKNKKAKLDTVISTKTSKIPILVIKTEEDWSIACSCLEGLKRKK